MRIEVTSDVERVIRAFDNLSSKQIPFALARALTRTAQDAQKDVREDLPRKFTLRNNWVSSGIRIKAATKALPAAEIGSLEPFMARQETGGIRTPRSHRRIAVPAGGVKRTGKGMIAKSQRPAALKGKPGVFLMRSKSGGGAGIVRRQGKARLPLQFLYWLKAGVTIKPRFGFQGTTGTSVRRAFGPNFIAAIGEAMRTAR